MDATTEGTTTEKILDFDNIMKGLKLVVPKNSNPIDSQNNKIWSGDNGKIEFEILSNNKGVSDLFTISPSGTWTPALQLYVPLPEEKCRSLGYSDIKTCCKGAVYISLGKQIPPDCTNVESYNVIFKLGNT